MLGFKGLIRFVSMKRKGLSELNPSERALYTKTHILIVSQLKL